MSYLKLYTLLAATLIFATSISAQENKSSINDLDFIVKKIEDNYSGYFDKKNNGYNKWAKTIRTKLSSSSLDSISIFQQLTIPVLLFKDMHLVISSIKPINFDSAFCINKLKEIPKQKTNVKDDVEGYWKSDLNDYIIYLKKADNSKGNQFEAIIVETTNKNAKPGSIKFYITKNKIDKYNTTAYLNSKGLMVGVFSYFASRDTLVTGINAKWNRLKDYHSDYLKGYTPFDYNASVSIIDSNYISIKIPRSDFATKHVVDSLVSVHKALIERTPNLIIDVRNNTGGSWLVYKSVFPYISTNPVLTGGAYVRCSEDFINHQKEYIEKCKIDSNLKEFLAESEEELDSMITHKGSFYYEKADTNTSYKFDSITLFPKRVIVLVNYRCASATEMFIKFCHQSKKAIIAGEKTWGAIDNVEIVPFESPSGNYKLLIPKAKMDYGKDSPIDFKGISPDITIPSTENNWYEYILKKLGK